MLAGMPAHILYDWQKYLRYGTLAERLIDKHLSSLAALLAGGLYKSSRKFKPKDFTLLPDKPVYRSPTYMRDKLITMTVLAGGTIIDKRNAS